MRRAVCNGSLRRCPAEALHRRVRCGGGHRRRLGHARPTLSDPLAEDWLPAFAIVEDAFTVDPRSHVHDSVVLRGGVVEPGAVVVRSLVCPGGVVRRDRSAVDQFVRRED